ncbi:MAG TPA: DUF58 domain-containing protein [Edaphocola sp.]|nr:DUF58 domain-containing protein [Edaphocola sp.]
MEDTLADSFNPLISLMGKMALGIFLLLILLSLISTIVAFLYYRQAKNKDSFLLKIQNSKDENEVLSITPSMKNVFRPLLGYISGRLLLKDFAFSDTFVLASTHYKKNSLRMDGIYGKGALYFPDIKEYQIKGSIIYFEDMLRLIRLPIKRNLTTSFYNAPKINNQYNLDVQPQSAKDMEERIQEMRKVEGEFLNYKQFEFGDDIRRIVWKIYGKNRELIVRNPETRNPFASKLEMYASFHNSIATLIPGNKLANELLNVYKNAIWSLYKSLADKQKWELIYLSEQQIPNNIEDVQEKVAYQIAQSHWQEHSRIEQYFNLKTGTVFCIHSLTNVEDLKHFIENGGAEKIIHFTMLSSALEQSKVSLWKRVFLLNDNQKGIQQLQTEWLLSPLRMQILKNERAINRVLQYYGF